MTLRTIADRVGVSRMTVSNAFSRPDQLSAELRDRILATATELGYAGPDPAARALARGHVGAIGVLLTDSLSHAFTDDVATRFLAAISDELASSGYALTLLGSVAHDDFVPARDIPLDGAIVYSCAIDGGATGWLQTRQLPIVFVDRAPVPGFHSVNIDDRDGARAAAQHLVDLGHRRIAIITNVADLPSGPLSDPTVPAPFNVTARWEGWIDALHAAGLEPQRFNATATTEQDGYAVGRILVDQPAADRPTGVLAFSDRIAAGVMSAAADAGLSVPDDLSVVGFDDAAFAATLRPPLTTVRQDVHRKGAEACRLLNQVIADGRPARAVRRLLPTELVVRASTAPPAS